MERFDDFLEAYRRIEDALRQITGEFDGATSFSRLLEAAFPKSKVVARNRNFLRTIRDLRNVLVHKGHGGRTLAEPTEEVVRESRSVADALTQPPSLPKYVYSEIRVFDQSEKLGDTLEFMRDMDFSQVPLADNGNFKALLTTNSIARWLARNVSEEIVEIKETPLSSVVQDKEVDSDYQFCSAKANCEVVIAIFEAAQERGELLQAVLLTDSGKPATNIRGIVTPHDLGKLYDGLSISAVSE